MGYRLLVAVCLAVVCACAVAAAPGVLSLAFAHTAPDREARWSVAGGRVVYEARAVSSRNPFTVPERWSAQLAPAAAPAGGPSRAWSRPVWQGGTVAEARVEVPLGWVATTAVVAAALPYVIVWRTTARRARRGLCARCGYDLRATAGGDPCPECGAARVDAAAGGRRRWPRSPVPAGADVARVVAVAGTLFFLLVVAAGAAVSWVGAADRLAVERDELRHVDVTRFVVDTSPRLTGDVISVEAGAGPPPAVGRRGATGTPVPAAAPGTLVLLGQGTFAVPARAALRDVAIVGVSPAATTLRLSLDDATRVRLENLTIDCADDPFLELRSGGTVALLNCVVVNYNSGAGGSNAVYGVDATLLIDGCRFDGAGGRSAGHGSYGRAFDLRGANRAYVRGTAFVDNDEVCRAHDLAFDACEVRWVGPAGPAGPRWGSGLGGGFFRASPTLAPRAGSAFELALDDPAFVRLADATAAGGVDLSGADAFTVRALDRLGCAGDPRYWLGLFRSPRAETRDVAARRLAALGHLPGPASPAAPGPDRVPALLAQMIGTDPVAARAARLELASASPTVAAAVDAAGAADAPPGVRQRVAELRRLRDLAVPLGVEVEYARLAAELVPAR
jgi:hypothetical protein